MLQQDKRIAYLQRGAVISLLLLIILCLGWERWWAPLRPGGSWLMLKGLPLLLLLRGLLHGRRYTAQWGSLFILFWLAEGLMRVGSDHGLSQILAGIEAILAASCFTCMAFYAKFTSAKYRPQHTAGQHNQ